MTARRPQRHLPSVRFAFRGGTAPIQNQQPRTLTLANDVTLDVSNQVTVHNNLDSPVSITGDITGNVPAFSKGGDGTLTLSGPNSYIAGDEHLRRSPSAPRPTR